MLKLTSINKFINFSSEQKKLLFVSATYMILYGSLLHIVPKKHLRFLLDNKNFQDIQKDMKPVNLKYLKSSINWMARALPYFNTCLVKSLVMRRLLQKYYIHASVYIGLQKNEYGKLYAHAWVESNDLKNFSYMKHANFHPVYCTN